MATWFKNNRDAIVRNSFLLPILLVVIMSISHVVSWYDLGNPRSWAIYLSVAIEIFAVASVSAASIKMSRGSIWFLFGLVTAIQVIGNIFYEFKDINPVGEGFVSWVQLIEPIFMDWDVLDHRRFLATIQGGTLPLMSLTALHFYIKFNDSRNDIPEDEDPIVKTIEKEFDEEHALDQVMNNMVNDLEDIEIQEIVDKEVSNDIESEAIKEFIEEYKEEQKVSPNKNTPSGLTASGTGLPVGKIRPNKGNEATLSLIKKGINPNTGQMYKNNTNDNGDSKT
jgi:hypothetical protein